MTRPEQSDELGPEAPHTCGLPSWLRANAQDLLAAPLLGHARLTCLVRGWW